jgi:hypothetical protein
MPRVESSAGAGPAVDGDPALIGAPLTIRGTCRPGRHVGLGSYLAIRRVPEHGVPALSRLSSSLRALLAAGVDMALIGAGEVW